MKLTRKAKIQFFPKLLIWGIHCLVRIVPRKKNKWVFSSHWKNGRFSDNSKYLFIEVCENHPEVKAIWVTGSKDTLNMMRNKGWSCVYRYSLAGFYHCLTSKVWVTTWGIEDVNRCLSGGAFLCNLWHGVSLKKVWWLAPEKAMEEWGFETYHELHDSFISKILNFSFLHRRPDMVLVPSTFQAETFFYKMFDIPKESLCLAGYPRNCFMRSEKRTVENFIEKYEPQATWTLIQSFQKYRHVFLYMPTWRNNGEDFISAAKIDWKLLNETLEKTESVLLLKLHPLTFNIDTKLDYLSGFKNLIIYPDICDIYTILPFTTCLITDYSSIYSDYVLMNKEIILFTYDYESYIKGSSEMDDYDKYFRGIRANSFKELVSVIETEKDCHLSQLDYDFLIKAYWECSFNGVDIAEEIKKRISFTS